MLNDNGIIIDDGVLACLGEGHYLVHTSSAGALNIHFWMEEWLQCELRPSGCGSRSRLRSGRR